MLKVGLPSPSASVRFRVIIGLAYAVILSILAWQFTQEWVAYFGAKDALRHFTAYKAAIESIGDLSAERGPTNSVLGAELPITAMARTRLDEARHRSDVRLEELIQTLQDLDCPRCANEIAIVNSVKKDLATARKGTDDLTGTALANRSSVAIGNAVDHMVDLIHPLASIAASRAVSTVQGDPQVMGNLYPSAYVTSLRDTAGLLGSRFTSALASQRALSEEETLAIERTMGNIDATHRIVVNSTQRHQSTPKALMDRVERRYFGDGMEYIARVRALASRPQGAGISPAEFADRYVPMMTPIVDLRDELLRLAETEIRHNLKQSETRLVYAGLAALFFTVLMMLMTSRFNKRIIRPFIEARKLILAIASGDTAVTVPQRKFNSEVDSLFAALRVLKKNSEERIALEKERRRLIVELKTMAETDPLTGLLNRRAFETRAKRLLADKRTPEPYVALIMFDIDHFKRINDTYGHESGDIALKKLAELSHETWRVEDIVARIGGEEFVALVRVHSPAQSADTAQRLRQCLHATTMTAVNGETFSMTASFGVALARKADKPDLADLLRRADALMYHAKQTGRDRIEVESSA